MQPASTRRRLGGRWAGPALLVLIPAMLGAGVWALKSRTSPGGARPGMTAVESWPAGGPKVLGREWSDGGAAFEEHCFYAPEGEELGCGTRRNGEPWAGTFVEWQWDRLERGPGEKSVVKHVALWREGRRHGTWRSYNPDGSLSVELVYENGALLERRITNAHGNTFETGQPQRPSPAALPPNRRPITR